MMRVSMKKLILMPLFLAVFSLCGVSHGQEPASVSAYVLYNGIAFNYQPEALGSLLPGYDQGTPYEVQAPYFANVAPHTSFKFMRPDPVYPDINLTAELRIYRVTDLEAYAEPTYRQLVEQLQNLDRTNLSIFANVNVGYDTPTLPFMPVLNATQVFRVHPRAMNTNVLSGIEYYAYYSVVPEPILEGQLLYVYQGMTIDGQDYISFSTPVVTGLLETAFPTNFDRESFVANYPTYIEQIFSEINHAQPDTFTPTPAVLHHFIESISIAP